LGGDGNKAEDIVKPAKEKIIPLEDRAGSKSQENPPSGPSLDASKGKEEDIVKPAKEEVSPPGDRIGFTPEMNKEHYAHISGEIARQYNVMGADISSMETKCGILLGFIVLVLAQVFLNFNTVKNVTSHTASCFLFVVGVGIIFWSAIFGIKAYMIRGYYGGVDMKEIMDDYRRGKDRNYQQMIDAALFSSTVINGNILKDKVTNIKLMMYAFPIGLATIIISLMVSMVGF
jgi:hypothetical protein